ncbi:MAG TPA: response regulator [Stellaceae bacterium]|nr:response regulator [Stellaceae bacterium]
MRTLLVVDDEPEICEVVKLGFETRGSYRVHCATNQLDAFAALRRQPPDLALLDMLMYGNARGEIEALAGELHVPVLRMTGHPDVMRKSRAQGLPILMKPFRIGELVDTVDRLLAEAFRLQRALAENVRTAQHLADHARANLAGSDFPWDQFAECWRRVCERTLGGIAPDAAADDVSSGLAAPDAEP